MPIMKKKARKTQPQRHILIRTFISTIPLSVLLGAWSARAQEGLTDAMANEAAARAQAEAAQSSSYTFREGDFRLLLSPSLGVQWNDNINCTQYGQQNDFILQPTLGVGMSYPLTDRNLLQLNVTVGYEKYVLHPQLSTWYLSGGSGLSFNVYIKDIIINLHDQISYVQNSAANAEVAGTGTYGTFNNSAGFSAKWGGLKHVDFTVGYDHQNSIASSAQFSDTDNSTESVYTRAGYRWNAALTTGLEGTFSYTTYNQNVLNDTTSYSIGVYGDWHPDKFLEIEPRGGYVINQYANSGQLSTAGLNSWYADLTLMHKITRLLNYSVDIGRNTTGGAQATSDEFWYVNTGVTWNFIRNFSFSPRLFFQEGKQGGGTTYTGAPGTASGFFNQHPNVLQQVEYYEWYGTSLAFNYDITRRISMGINYQFTQRTSQTQNRGYLQNVIGIQVSYHPI
jgi:hypothetical protein